MKFELKVAWRYFISPKKVHAINIINYIAIAGMGVGAFALIVVLSVFNGFENLIVNLQAAFYPEIIVKPASGKYLTIDSQTVAKIKALPQVEDVAITLEEQAYLEYADRSAVATVKGVSSNFTNCNRISEFMLKGSFTTGNDEVPAIVLGGNLAASLNVSMENQLEMVKINVPKNVSATIFIPEDAFGSLYVPAAGVFAIQQEFDSRYVFLPLETLQSMTGNTDAASAFEVKLKNPNHADAVRRILHETLGPEYDIQTRDEVNATLYRIVKTERWAVIAILTFIISIISFNILGALSMLAIEKKKDVSILKALGAKSHQITNIFLLIGTISGLSGAFFGVVAGLLICLLQQQFGLIKLVQGSGTFVIDAYPVKILFSDVVVAFFVVALISLIASFIPAFKSSRQVVSLSD